MNDIDKTDYFDKYIKELYKINTDNPKKAKDIAKNGLDELGLLKKASPKNNKLGIDINWAIIVIICLLMFLGAFLTSNMDSAMLYIFGVIFFLAGLFIGLYVPVFGLIFLLSHGITGFVTIFLVLLFGTDNMDSINIILNNPLYTDGGMPFNIKIYLISICVLFVAAFIYTILHNLSPKLKKNKIHAIIILSLYLITIILIGLFSRVFPFLFS